jgi:hypothetical protein
MVVGGWRMRARREQSGRESGGGNTVGGKRAERPQSKAARRVYGYSKEGVRL